MGRLKALMSVFFFFSALQFLLHQRKLPSLKVASIFGERKVALHIPDHNDDFKSKYNYVYHQSNISSNSSTTTNQTESSANALANNRQENDEEILSSIPIIQAMTGGKLPLSPYYDYADPSTWPAIDNETCRGYHHHDVHDAKGWSLKKPYFEWQRRAPYAMLLGTMKGGTQALVQYLYQHPLIAPREGTKMEEHFFNSQSFVRDENGIPVRRNQKRYARRFQQYYPTLFENSNNDSEMIAIDNTPFYLFGSEQIPSAVLCVAPWVKLLAILRNPVDRVDSQYHYLHQNRQIHYNKDMVDWDVWVNHDIQLLQTAGVLQDWNVVDFDTFAGSEAEMLAWKRYVRSPQNSMFLVGRGLYAIQLQHWFQAMQRAGKPASDLMVIHAEKMRNSTQSVYNDILQFLELPRFVLNDTAPKHTTKIKSALPMPESIRKTLEKLYEPYNQRLYKMLGWDNVWDSSASAAPSYPSNQQY